MGTAADPSQKPVKAGKPAVSLRATPRVAAVPARVVFTADLKGGEDSEALHCLDLKWTWGDGGTSSATGDCGAFVAGQTKVQRVFQASHEYRRQGRFEAQVELLKGERTLSRDSITLNIAPPRTGTKFEYNEGDR